RAAGGGNDGGRNARGAVHRGAARPGPAPVPRPAVDGGDLPGATVRAAEDRQEEGGDPPVLPGERGARVCAARSATRSPRAAERPTHRARPRGRGVPPRLVRLWTRPARLARRLL